MSYLPVALAFALAYACAWILSRIAADRPQPGRYSSIDGLRGYLAFSVVLHHTSIWWVYLHTGRWLAPESAFFNNLGQGAVALFFMITAFLFSDKLMAAQGRDFDWLRLYVSRFMRLTPLYLLAVSVAGLLALAYQGGLQEPIQALALRWLRWAFFDFLGTPDLNGMKDSFRIVAGVFWTLPYEWLFYLGLPALARALRVKAPGWTLALCVAALFLALSTQRADAFMWLTFGGGILAAALVRRPRWVALAKTRGAGLVALACLGTSFSLFHSSWGPAPLVLLGSFFCIVAAGNGLFGLLHRAASHTLGEMAYSIYLLHGIFLFIAFSFILPAGHSLLAHWAALLALTPLLLGTCFLTFRRVERPGIEKAPGLTRSLRAALRTERTQPL